MSPRVAQWLRILYNNLNLLYENFLLAITFFAGISAAAQISKGSHFLGGDVGFSHLTINQIIRATTPSTQNILLLI